MSSRRNSPARPSRSVTFADGTESPAPRRRPKTPGPHRSRQLAEMTVASEFVVIPRDELQLLREGLLGGRPMRAPSSSTPSPRKTPRSARSRRSTPGGSGRSEAARRRRRDSHGRFLPTPEGQEHRDMEPVRINFDDAAASEESEATGSVSTTTTDASETSAETTDTRDSMTDVQEGRRRVRRPDSPDPRRRMSLAQPSPRRQHPHPPRQQHPDLPPLPPSTSSVHDDTSAEDDGVSASVDDARTRRKSAALKAALQKSPEVRQVIKEMVAECLADASAPEEEEAPPLPPRARSTPRRPRGRSTPRRRPSTPRR